MTHDPLCPTAGWPTQPCVCDVIARVRKDEYLKAYRKGYNERGLADAQSRAMFGGWEYNQHGKGENP